MCRSSGPPGPSKEQKRLMAEQTEALERQEEQLETEKQRVGQEAVQQESRRRRGSGPAGLFGSRAGFGAAGTGSMFKPRG